MSLAHATSNGTPLGLPGTGPFAASDLGIWMGKPIQFRPGDPFVTQGGSRSHLYLDGARDSWNDNPDWMDFLQLDSPIYDLKFAERDLYLHHWGPWLDAKRVLDVGCGIGRFTTAFLDRGATVWGVDADERALERCVWHSANRPGHLDLSWSSVHTLPPVTVDLAIAAEVLCYVPRTQEALEGMVERLRPGGAVLLAMEARWGWAASQDAPAGRIHSALSGDGVVYEAGERWVRTLTREQLHDMLQAAGLEVVKIEPMLYTLDGPLEGVLPERASLEDLIAFEAACAEHPIWGPLNRIWTAVALKPR